MRRPPTRSTPRRRWPAPSARTAPRSTSTATQDLTLSGLISGPRTLNGSSTTKLKGVIADIFGSSTLDATLTTTITNLVIPNKTAAGAQPWPSSGTIVVESTGTVGGAAIPTIRISMAFSGTSTVNVSRTGPGGTQNCKMDLAKPDPGVPVGR